MAENGTTDTTQLLRAWADGNAEALSELVPRVQRELCRLAGHYLRNERAGKTLQTTDLVQELYLKLMDIRQLDWRHRAHFFAVSATLMRRILLDRARRKAAAKRGRRPIIVDLESAIGMSVNRSEAMVSLDDALNALAEIDSRKARIVELRFFGGLEVKEIAAVVGVSPETVMRDWRLARSWLLRELSRSRPAPDVKALRS
jgi:RNA polymerase sigma factor (TIGR02999 family)